MSFVVFGINHRTSPLSLLEKVAIAPADIPKMLRIIQNMDDIREVVLLSTCNRTEVYATVERFHDAHGAIRSFFCNLGDLDVNDIQPFLYYQHDEAAVRHLFNVAAGLDSAVLGEHEILGQVKLAWDEAMREGTSRSELNLVFRHAVETGKRARTETEIGRATASVSQAGVEMAVDAIGSLSGRTVMVVGAGDMGVGVAGALAREGADIVVTNRTGERADDLAVTVNARVAPFSSFEDELATIDMVVTCTGAGTVILTSDIVQAARVGTSKPLMIVDIALPRDVESSVGMLPGVTLKDLSHLREWADKGRESRASEAARVEAIVDDEVERYVVDSSARQMAPLIAQIRDLAESIRVGELTRYEARLASLSAEQREVVESLTSGILAKLLHGPTVHLKSVSGSPQGARLAGALRELFDLD
jgi:glutamyl-tRNA reductase